MTPTARMNALARRRSRDAPGARRCSRAGALVAWLRRAQPCVRVPRGRRRRRRSSARAARTSRRSIREELAGTFFTMDLERARDALAQRAVGARRRAAPAVAATGSKSPSRSTSRSRAGTNARSSTRTARCSPPTSTRRAAAVRRAGGARRARWPSAIARGRDALAPLALDVARACACRRAAAGSCARRQRRAARRSSSAATSRMRASRASSPRIGRTIGALARAARESSTVDLRYRNGFAARVPGFPREEPAKPAAEQKRCKRRSTW